MKQSDVYEYRTKLTRRQERISSVSLLLYCELHVTVWASMALCEPNAYEID